MQVETRTQLRELGIIMISIILLVSLVPLGFFEPVYADHQSKVLKLQRPYPADVGFVDISLPMRINDIENTIVFLSFSTPDTADQSDTSRRWELIDDRTLRVFGESNTPTGNNAGNMIIYIVEMRADEFDIDTQNFVFNFTADQTPNKKSIALSPAINSSRAFVLFNGLENLAPETSWGSEEFYAVQVNDTHIDFEVTEIPNTAGVLGFSVIHANVTGVLAQRGSGVLNGTTPFDEVTDTITPPIAVDRDHTIVLITGRIEPVGELNADPDEVMVQVTINPSNDIIIHRDDNAPLHFIYEWQTISFPPTFINVTHGEISMIDTETIVTDTFSPAVLDMDKSFVISGAGSPFGYGTGTCDTGTAGAMDRCMNRLILTDMDTVTATREDSSGTNIVNYQVIQILETEVPEVAQGTNEITQIVKLKGTIPSAVEHDVTISPALTNVNKTMLFATFSSDGSGGGDPAGGRKSYEIFNSTTLRFFGNSDPSVTNPPVNFTAVLVEFSQASPVVIQNEFFNYPQGLDAGEKTIHMSPVNTTGTTIITMGRSLSGTDGTLGQEEIDRIRILTSNTWGYDIETFQDFGGVDGSTVVRADIVDFNGNLVSVQRGQLDMTGLSTSTVVPASAIIQNQTMLIFSHQTANGDFTDSPDTASVHGTVNSSNEIVFTRPVSTGGVEINWELISFPSVVTVEHGVHHQDALTENATSTVTAVADLANSFAIGTSGFIGFGTGSGDNAVDSPTSFLDIISTVELEDPTTVRIARGTSVGDFDIGFQVIQFPVAVGVIELNILDTVTLPPLDPNFNIDKTAVDFSSFIDVSTNKNITKLGSDIVSSGDTISTGIIFVVNLSDTGEALDVLAINVTKLAEETVGIGDDPSFVITKLLEDTASISDIVGVVVVFGVEILDTVTTNDLVILNITKQLSDVASIIDDLNLAPSKVFLDTTVVVDQTESSTDTDVDETDTITIPDDLLIDVRKLIEDIATMQDQVVLIRAIDLALNDTVSVSDPSILFKITTAVSGTGGGGGGTPLPQFERIVGLNIESELIQIKPTDRVNSDFKISYFGSDRDLVTLTKITIEDTFFSSWLTFSPLPDSLDFVQTMDGSRTVNDPARFINLALDDFIVTAPPRSCDDVNIFDQDQGSCIDPLLYSVPLEFEFTKNGVKFHADHDLLIDARIQEVRCNIFIELPQTVCDTINFGTDNWFWFLAIFGVLYFVYLLIPRISPSFRTVRKVHRSDLESMSDRRIKRKFKRGKRR